MNPYILEEGNDVFNVLYEYVFVVCGVCAVCVSCDVLCVLVNDGISILLCATKTIVCCGTYIVSKYEMRVFVFNDEEHLFLTRKLFILHDPGNILIRRAPAT